MNFDFTTKTFRDLLGSNFNQLVIPRFQRDYTWEDEHTREFLEDLISNLKQNTSNDNKQLVPDYFFGTILVTGNMTGSNGFLEVIDGQQRITTATILLSTIGKILKSCDEIQLAKNVWEYIIKTTDDEEKITLLQNDTTDDFFKEKIQDLNIPLEDVIKINETPDEETKCILNAVKLFQNYLSENSIKNNLKSLLGDNNELSNKDYISILKKIRDLLLNSQVVCVSTTDKNSANLIFEILNSKGKKLEPIDLIKNEIFKHLTTTQPKDYASGKWKKIKHHLSERERIEFSTFYRHFWLSQYPKVNNSDLHDQFLLNINNKSNYDNFLDQLVNNAKIYKMISSPNFTIDFQNKKQYSFIVESLTNLNNFKIRQCRVALLAIFRKKEENRIKTADLYKVISFLPKFHFIYSALCSKRANTLESKYAKFAVDLTKSDSTNKSKDLIEQFIQQLKTILPNEQEFTDRFIKLEYSNRKRNDQNLVTKYAIYELERIFSKKRLVSNTASIEHIIPESEHNTSREVLNIGNLCILENDLNEKCNNHDINDKFKIYKESQFLTTKDLLKHYPTGFTNNNIEERAHYLAHEFYQSL